jgi:hypothetical protein
MSLCLKWSLLRTLFCFHDDFFSINFKKILAISYKKSNFAPAFENRRRILKLGYFIRGILKKMSSKTT